LTATQLAGGFGLVGAQALTGRIECCGSDQPFAGAA
jgi:hypothetical protein